MNKNRRSFLKVAGLSVFALAGGFGTEAQAAGKASYEAAPKALKAKRWAMVIDTRAFRTADDYKDIIAACHAAHNVPDVRRRVDGHELQEIKWIWTDSYEHVFPDDMNEHLSAGVRARVYPLLCNHCTNPPCVRVCPTQATYQLPNGVVTMDYHRCIGCRFCMAGCPYGARSFNFRDPQKYVREINPEYPMRTRGVVEKCTFCEERLAKGQLPACVEASEGAMIFGDLNDPDSPVRQALARNYTIRRKPSLGTQPGVYYII